MPTRQPDRPDDDGLLREIDFLILAAEQSGDTRDSIRLILASLRDTNVRLRGLAEEVNGLRNDLSRHTEALPSIDERLRNLEGKVGDGSGFRETIDHLQAEWRSTKLLIVGLFLIGGLTTVCLLTLVIVAQVYWLNP